MLENYTDKVFFWVGEMLMFSIHADRENAEQLIIRFQYSDERVEKIRSISGRVWHAQERYWTIPFVAETITKLIEFFSDEEIFVEPEIQKTLIMPSARCKSTVCRCLTKS